MTDKNTEHPEDLQHKTGTEAMKCLATKTLLFGFIVGQGVYIGRGDFEWWLVAAAVVCIGFLSQKHDRYLAKAVSYKISHELTTKPKGGEKLGDL